MKVRLNPGASTRQIAAGVDHLVVGVYRWNGEDPFVMLLDEEDFPFGADLGDVVTVDDRIPSCWTAVVDDGGALSVQPGPWQHAAFWHVFWGEEHSRAGELPRNVRPIFEEELARIRREVG